MKTRDPSNMPAVRKLRSAASICVALTLSPVAFAEHLFGAPAASDAAPVSGIATAGQMTLALTVVLAAVFAAAWLMRRFRGFGQRDAQSIEVLANVSLGGKERAVLIQVGGTQLLVGVAPGQVNTLLVVGGNSTSALNGAPAILRETPEQNPTPIDAHSPHQFPASFKAILKRSLGMS